MKNAVIFLSTAFIMGLCSGQPVSAQSYIEVSGQAEQQVPSDYMNVALYIEAEGKTAREVQESVMEKTKAVLALLQASSVVSDIHSQHINLSPNHRDDNYNARKLVSFRLRELNQYESLILKLIDAGVTRHNAGGYDIMKRDKREVELLGLAVLNARQKAEILAAQSGKKLGDVISISEMGLGGSGPRPYMSGLHVSKAVSQELFAETLVTLSQQVIVRFALKP